MASNPGKVPRRQSKPSEKDVSINSNNSHLPQHAAIPSAEAIATRLAQTNLHLLRPSLFDTSIAKSSSSSNSHHTMPLSHSLDCDDQGGLLPPKRPRRLWCVSDTQLPKLPVMYPPLSAQTSRRIRHTPPSVVAIRIAECLRLRSVAVEYEEESASASCMTVDRCHFQIQLWRATTATTVTSSSSSSSSPASSNTKNSNSKNDICLIVDCLRVRGPLLTFHRTVHALLEAAESLDTGATLPKPFASSALEFPRLTCSCPTTSTLVSVVNNNESPPQNYQYAQALDALERVLNMLRKDRIEAQELGMEYLVSLTDLAATLPDTALYCALAVVGAPVTSGLQQTAVFTRELHKDWIMGLLVDRVMPGEPGTTDALLAEPAASRGIGFAFSCASSLLGDGSARKSSAAAEELLPVTKQQQRPVTMINGGDEHHGGKMRSMALRVFTNALVVLEGKGLLPRILASQPHLVAPRLLRALIDDTHGAMRHSSVAIGTRLASQHEAVLAIRCLRILASHSERAEQSIVTESSMELLDKARSVGESNHLVLAEEANKTYLQLTEDFRSC